MTIRCTHRVGLLLTGLPLVTLALPFVTYAPGESLTLRARAVAGAALARRRSAGGGPCRDVALLAAGQDRAVSPPAAGRTDLPAAYLGQRHAALELSRYGSPLARTLARQRPVVVAGALSAAGQRGHPSSHRPAALALTLNAQVWLLPIILLAIGALDQLSLLKEYANRQEVFDDALRQHLLLLFGTLLPGLLDWPAAGGMAVAASALAGAGFHRAQCDPDYSVE